MKLFKLFGRNFVITSIANFTSLFIATYSLLEMSGDKISSGTAGMISGSIVISLVLFSFITLPGSLLSSSLISYLEYKDNEKE